MKTLWVTAVCLSCALSACSSIDNYSENIPTNSPPIIDRVDPNAGAPGDTISIYGFGFSVAPPENIVVIGGAATSAASYNLLPDPTDREIEVITAEVPTGAEVGEGAILVEVDGNASNSDVSFTVTP
jgi:hypothetical protein